MKSPAVSPGDGLSPTNYGWFTNKDGRLQPIWFEGPAAPSSLFGTTDNTDAGTEIDSDSDETIITGIDEDLDELSDSDDEPWSEDSDSDQDDENLIDTE